MDGTGLKLEIQKNSWILRFWDSDIPGFWASQILRFSDYEILNFWDSGTLECWDFDILRFCWIHRHRISNFENLKISDFWNFRFSDSEIPFQFQLQPWSSLYLYPIFPVSLNPKKTLSPWALHDLSSYFSLSHLFFFLIFSSSRFWFLRCT